MTRFRSGCRHGPGAPRAAAALGAALALLACGERSEVSAPSGSPTGVEAAENAPVVIGVSYQALRFPFVAALQRAAQARARALGVRLVEADAGNDVAAELSNVENLLQQSIGCLAFEATSLDGSIASIEAANRSGVPVVQFNGRANGGRSLTFVGSEQRESGDLLGQWLAAQLAKSGRTALRGLYLRGLAGQVTDLARSEALRARLDRDGIAAKIELIEQHADYDRATAQARAEAVLAAHPDLDFIVANNDDMILGALEAVEASGRGGRLALAGVDGLPETLARIAEGRIAATVFQDPEGQGAGAIQACADHLAGKPLPPQILIPFELVTAENAAAFAARAKRVYASD
jgi:ABC-type sugar transport system substrate-binding protein